MKVYVKDILKANEETREKLDIIEISMDIKNHISKGQELIITNDNNCYLENDSKSVEDFICSYVQVEDYNKHIYKTIVECEFRIRYYTYLKEYYSSLKTEEKDCRELERYKDRYLKLVQDSKVINDQLIEAHKTIKNLEAENNTLKLLVAKYENQEKPKNGCRDEKFNRFSEMYGVPTEVLLATEDIFNTIFGGKR